MPMQIIVTINWATGRSNEVKKEIVEKLAPGIAERTRIPLNKIFIYFYDVPGYNSGVEGKYMG